MNLIEQQNYLKNLSDEELSQQAQAPEGLPPFLVVSEMKRRADMRENYEAHKAKGGTLSEKYQSQLAGAMSPANMGGRGSLSPASPSQPFMGRTGVPQMPKFQDGGLVGPRQPLGQPQPSAWDKFFMERIAPTLMNRRAPGAEARPEMPSPAPQRVTAMDMLKPVQPPVQPGTGEPIQPAPPGAAARMGQPIPNKNTPPYSPAPRMQRPSVGGYLERLGDQTSQAATQAYENLKARLPAIVDYLKPKARSLQIHEDVINQLWGQFMAGNLEAGQKLQELYNKAVAMGEQPYTRAVEALPNTDANVDATPQPKPDNKEADKKFTKAIKDIVGKKQAKSVVKDINAQVKGQPSLRPDKGIMAAIPQDVNDIYHADIKDPILRHHMGNIAGPYGFAAGGEVNSDVPVEDLADWLISLVGEENFWEAAQGMVPRKKNG